MAMWAEAEAKAVEWDGPVGHLGLKVKAEAGVAIGRRRLKPKPKPKLWSGRQSESDGYLAWYFDDFDVDLPLHAHEAGAHPPPAGDRTAATP